MKVSGRGAGPIKNRAGKGAKRRFLWSAFSFPILHYNYISTKIPLCCFSFVPSDISKAIFAI